MSNYAHKDDFKIEVKFSKFSARFPTNGAIRQNTLDSFSSSALNFQAYSEVLFKLLLKLTAQCTIFMNNLCHETCRALFLMMTVKSKFLLAHPKMAHLVKIPFIVFYLARLIFTGQTSHLDMTYPEHSSFFRIFYLSIDLYSRTVMAL